MRWKKEALILLHSFVLEDFLLANLTNMPPFYLFKRKRFYSLEFMVLSVWYIWSTS